MSNIGIYRGMNLFVCVLSISIMFMVLSSMYVYPTFNVKYDMMMHDITNNNYDIVNYSNLMKFIKTNDIDNRTYHRFTYNCLKFSIDLIKEANNNNIYCGLCIITYDNNIDGHAIVCFKTIDRGLIFIEPQSDKDVTSELINYNEYHNKEISSLEIYWN